MEEFLRLATSQLGVSEQTARSATSQLLGFLKQNAGADDTTALLEKLPGARELLSSAKPASSGRPGGVMGTLGNLLGGKAGSSLGLLAVLKNSGLDAGDTGRFVGMFLDFVRTKAGAGVVDGLMAKVPELKSLQG